MRKERKGGRAGGAAVNRLSRVDASCGLQAPAIIWVRAGSDYGQTLREAFGPMKMQKCPKSVLSAFTLEAEVQRMSPPKEPRWQHF